MTPKAQLDRAKEAQKIGDLLLARDFYQAVLKRMPRNADAAKSLKKLEAHLSSQRAPLTPAEVQDLGRLIEAEAFDPATKVLRELLWRAPGQPILHLHRGLLAARQGQPEAAIVGFERALELAPEFAEARVNLALALSDVGRAVAARDALAPILEQASDNPQVMQTQASVLLQLGQGQAALAAIDQAILAAPDIAPLHLTRSEINTSIGDRDAARADLERALELAPEDRAARVFLVRLLKAEASEDDISILRTWAADPGESALGRSVYAFALADVFDARKDVAQAAELYRAANAERAKVTAHDAKAAQARFDQLRKWQAGKRARLAALTDAPKLVFVVGMNRSGTSLAEQMLDNHPDVFGAGELDLIDRFASRLQGPLHKVPAETFEAFRALYLSELTGRSDAPVIVDKMPANFIWSGLITYLFPDARILWMQRDARDVALSNFKASYGSAGHAYCYDAAALGGFMALQEDYAQMWSDALGDALRLQSYEALAQDPEAEIKAICAWLGLAFDPAMLEFHRSDRTVRTLSQGQVHRPVYTSSIGRWEAYRDHLLELWEAI